MSRKVCRVCDNNLFSRPLLILENMPRAAQYLPDSSTLRQDKGVKLCVCQCSGCGLVQLDCDPVPYYREVIRASGVSEEMKKFRLKQFSDFVEKYSLRNRKVIEIGCGRGEYLSLIKKTGVKAYGIEFSKESVAVCRKMGLKVEKAFIDRATYKVKGAPFQAFMIFSFLEHLPDPNSTLRGIWNNLDEDGVGIVEVPNFDMIIKKRLFSEFIRDHLLYFTKETLLTILNLNGFEVLECNEVWHDYVISATVRKRQALDLSIFLKHQDKMKDEMNNFLRRFKNKKIAIWGAGHQALALISLLNIKDKVRYVVDSAPFKQGRFTPATHLPIVSQERLKSDPVEAVIIAAGSYSDEVAKIVIKDFDKKVKVAIVRDFGVEVIR